MIENGKEKFLKSLFIKNTFTNTDLAVHIEELNKKIDDLHDILKEIYIEIKQIKETEAGV